MNEAIKAHREKVRQHVAGFFTATIQNIVQNIGPAFRVTIICRNVNVGPLDQGHFVFGNDHDEDLVVEAFKAMRSHEIHYFDPEGVKQEKH